MHVGGPRDPVGSGRDEEVEFHRPARGSVLQCVDQLRRARRAVCDHEDVRLVGHRQLLVSLRLRHYSDAGDRGRLDVLDRARQDGVVTTSRRLSNLAILAVLACALVYVIALGTHPGLRLDRDALPHGALHNQRWEHAHAALHVVLESLSAATMAIVGGAAILVALRRGRRDLAIAAAAILLGANVTTTILKPLLALADPLGGEPLRAKSGAFPSGHATAAMSLAVGTVL